MTPAPLVSCIMPTRGRRPFVERAIEYFRSQDYPNRELIVVDDGDDRVADLVPRDGRFRYIRLGDVHTVGSKRNVACDQAAGTVIAHWDDDDWYAPHRLTCQVDALLAAEADVCGLANPVFYDADRAKAWQYTYPENERPWVHGGTLCYRRSFWAEHRFADVSEGEDALFVWSAPVDRVLVLPDRSIYVATIHPGNTSPKVTDGPRWRPLPMTEVRSIVVDPSFFQGDGTRAAGQRLEVAPVVSTTRVSTTRPVRNVYACLAHEAPECVIDLVRNLRHVDPESPILLYNGGTDPTLFDGVLLEEYGAAVVPSPRQMAWGRLHDFSLDSMRFALATLDFDTLTIVDSDQLATRRGYSSFIAPAIDRRSNVGLLANATETQVPGAAAPPAMAALDEVDLWRPFLRRFRRGEELFPRWCFWPSTVFTRDAARELTRLFDVDAGLQQIMERTQIWATEEVILPTLVALLGFEAARSPCSYDLVKYREPYTVDQLTRAMTRPDVFWVHPVPRRYDDPLRTSIRRFFDDYRRDRVGQAAATITEGRSATRLLPTLPVLERMRPLEGWLEDEEADLLLAAAAASLRRQPTHPILEIGSYCGRSTVVLASAVLAIAPDARVVAIDPHDGTVGALDQGVTAGNGTLARFRRNIADAGVDDVVTIVQRNSYDVEWEGPIGMLFIDGLHDFANVARDFRHFARFLAPGSLIAFHDYADYYPGVVAFVDHLTGSGDYQRVAQARSMMVIEPVSDR